MASRKLWGAPLLAADWENLNYEEHQASWWELFVDLVLVVTCSTVAEKFEEDMIEGVSGCLWPFLVTYAICFSGWVMYTSFSSRFIDNSLLHSVQLFIYLMATCYMVTNTSGFEFAQDFAWSAIVQRCSMLFMYLTLAIQVPKARNYCFWICSLMLGGIAFLYTAAVTPDEEESGMFLKMAALWECILVYPIMYVLVRWSGRVKFIALNIDHNTERMGCCVMVILGESVVSALINYHKIDPVRTPIYLQAMGLSMCLTFALALIFFALKPPRHMHALRRSGLTGICFTIIHLFLTASLLALGVGVKLAMHTILQPEIGRGKMPPGGVSPGGGGEPDGPTMHPWHAFLLFASTTAAMLSILVLRLLHYGGREPRPEDGPLARGIKYGWWLVFMATTVLTLAIGLHAKSAHEEGLTPIRALKLVVGIVLGFALFEHVIMHVLSEMGFIDESAHGLLHHEGPPHEDEGAVREEPSPGVSETEPLLAGPAAASSPRGAHGQKKVEKRALVC